MRHLVTVNALTLGTLLLGGHSIAQTPLTLQASDGLTLYATQYPNPRARAVLLMFHQAGSNKAEYAPTAPELVKLGFAGLALDQRSGGSLFGADNQTVKAAGKEGTYLDTLTDLEAAIGWAKKQHPGKPIWLMGSSYSSALVFLAAAKHPEVKAILAFSPDEYLDGGTLVHDAAKQLKNTAVFITSAKLAGELEAARSLFNAVPGPLKTLHVPTRLAKHGASVLRPEAKNFGGTEAWAALEGFVKKHLK